MFHSTVDSTQINFLKKAATTPSQSTNADINSSSSNYNFVLLLLPFKGSIEPNVKNL